MFGIENFMTFMVSTLLFVMIPGMDTFFVLNKSISNGRKSGVVASIGVNTGILMHTLLSAVGLTVIISKSELAFNAVKFIGAIYVIYLGLKQLKDTTEIRPSTEDSKGKQTSKTDFWSGFVTNALNPKVALFFLVFFPQFISPSQLESPVPFLLLGVTYALIGVVWYIILTLFASTFSERITSNPKSGLWINRISGLIFVLLGLQVAFGN